MSLKHFVLDTNVLLHDPRALSAFGDNKIILPIYVIEEIDNFKKEQNELGRNARETSRILDKLREKGSLMEGVPMGKGFLQVKTARQGLPEEYVAIDRGADTKILAVAWEYNRQIEEKVIFVTKDINLRIRANAIGLESVDYKAETTDISEFYTGTHELQVEKNVIDELFNKKVAPIPKGNFEENSFGTLTAGTQSALVRFFPREGKIKPIRAPQAWGINGKNREQNFALELLLDDNIQLVTLLGHSGTGKTLLSLAAGLEKIMEEKKYNQVLASRAIVPLDRDIGFLPGPQPLDSRILTPNGWTTMGKIKIGDNVVTRMGRPSKVLRIYPKGEKPVYRLTTTDGTSTECCLDHLWITKTFEEKKRQKQGCVRTTQQILDTITVDKNPDRLNHYLPRNRSIEYTKIKLPIPPYTLGVILGDGSISNSVAISVTDSDKEIVNRVEKEISCINLRLYKQKGNLIYSFSRIHQYNNKPANSVSLTFLDNNKIETYSSVGIASEATGINRSTIGSRCRKKAIVDNIKYEFLLDAPRWTNPIRQSLYELGLEGTKATTKFIPNLYKYSSIDQRIALLQGLMDTDGTIKKRGEASFCTSSKQLAEDIQEIIRSLGGRASLRSRDRCGKVSIIGERKIVTRHISYEFTVSLPKEINPFFLQRKAERHKCAYIYDSRIASIEYTVNKKVQCILIEDEEHLYITDDFIVTHNTEEEKIRPWMSGVCDNLEFLMNLTEEDKKKGRSPDELFNMGVIKIEPLVYLRGRSIPKRFILLDEAQNASSHVVKTLLTRAGEGTKIVLVGDHYQCDDPYLDSVNNGLVKVINSFKGQPNYGHITLTKGERSNLAELSAKLL